MFDPVIYHSSNLNSCSILHNVFIVSTDVEGVFGTIVTVPRSSLAIILLLLPYSVNASVNKMEVVYMVHVCASPPSI